jgi:DNA-binding transcriptional ArsR family regulator
MTVGGGRYDVAFDARPAYDFLLSLAVDDDLSELPAEDQAWLRDARASLPADVRAGMFVGKEQHHGLASEVAAVIVERPDVRSARALVTAIEAMSPVEICRPLLGCELGEGYEELVERVIAGDDAAAADAEERLVAEAGEKHRATITAVLRDPLGTTERLHLALRAWLPLFQPIEDRISRALDRDVVGRRAAAERLAPADLIEAATGGIRMMASAELRRVILAPSYFARPFNYMFAAPGWRLFCYPLADDALGEVDPHQPPLATIRLYRALGDESRLRILRLLSDHDMYLTELAQALELSKPTVKHHLAQLRVAGLVTMTEEGALTYYSLRRPRLDEAGVELHRYLG